MCIWVPKALFFGPWTVTYHRICSPFYSYICSVRSCIYRSPLRRTFLRPLSTDPTLFLCFRGAAQAHYFFYQPRLAFPWASGFLCPFCRPFIDRGLPFRWWSWLWAYLDRGWGWFSIEITIDRVVFILLGAWVDGSATVRWLCFDGCVAAGCGLSAGGVGVVGWGPGRNGGCVVVVGWVVRFDVPVVVVGAWLAVDSSWGKCCPQWCAKSLGSC